MHDIRCCGEINDVQPALAAGGKIGDEARETYLSLNASPIGMITYTLEVLYCSKYNEYLYSVFSVGENLKPEPAHVKRGYRFIRAKSLYDTSTWF